MQARRTVLLSALAALAAGCGDATAPRAPAFITLSTGALALDALGAAQQVGASVLDQDHVVIPNVSVTWSSSAPGVAAVSGSGVVSAVANGAAVVQAKVGAVVSTATVQVTQIAVAPQKVSGDQQNAEAASVLPQPLRVRIVDRLGSAMASQAVTFTVQGGGTLGTPHVTSASDGAASTTWTLGATVAQNQVVTASVGNDGPASVFTANATAGPPASIGFANDGQALLMVGAQTPGTASARDAHGNPVGAVPLTYVSRNTAVATVNAAGLISGVSRGQAVIVVSSAAPAFTDSLLAVVGVPGAPVLISSLAGFSLKADTTRTVSLFVNMGTSGTNVSSGIVTVSWDPAAIQFVSSSAGAGVAAVANTSGTASGNLSLAFASAAGATGNVEVLQIVFHAAQTPGTASALTLLSNEVTASDFSDLTPNLVQVLQRFVLR
jgi:hypothetical protein